MSPRSPPALRNETSLLDSSKSFASSFERPLCSGFFSVLSSAWLRWENDCSEVVGRVSDRLRMQDEQMKEMDQVLTLFTTWNASELKECDLHEFRNINFSSFDPLVLLPSYGFSVQQLAWMKMWNSHTRLSDVFRIALAAEHGMTYLDLDMMLLNPNPRVYLDSAVVAAPVDASHHRHNEQAVVLSLPPDKLA